MLPLARSLDCVHVGMYMWCVFECVPKLVSSSNTIWEE